MDCVKWERKPELERCGTLTFFLLNNDTRNLVLVLPLYVEFGTLKLMGRCVEELEKCIH